MITYLRKGKLRKEVVTDGVTPNGTRSITSYKTMVFRAIKMVALISKQRESYGAAEKEMD